MFIETPVCKIARVFCRPQVMVFCLLFCVTFALTAAPSIAQNLPLMDQSQASLIDEVLPTSSSNAALHYQRALLFLSAVDREQQLLLDKPIWEIVHADTTEKEVESINRLLIESRHAIRSAIVGAVRLQADFGADPRQYAATKRLPHVVPMLRLAKLVTLHGMQRQATGNWREAAINYLNVVRMGRHMSRQLTLAESIVAVRILETGYHVLADWAVRCPNAALIKQVRSQLIAVSPNSISPAAAIRQEANILQLGLTNLQHAYPNGNWAEMILVAIDAPTASLSPEEMKATARSMVLQRGVAKSVFDNKESFDAHIDKLRTINRQYYQELLTCFTLPITEAIREGEHIHEKYASQLKRLGDPNTLNASQIAAYFAVHQAEHQLTQVVLSLSAHKLDGRFPKDLSTAAADFGGTLPACPYHDGPPDYSITDGGTGMRISYPEVKIGNVAIPKLEFKYAGTGNPPVEN
jgi:hypothetical protein